MKYNRLVNEISWLQAILLAVFFISSCEIEDKSRLVVSVEDQSSINDTIIVSHVDDYRLFRSGISNLVIDTLILHQKKAVFEYSYKKLNDGVIRLNFYQKRKGIRVAGAVENNGSKTNYIFWLPSMQSNDTIFVPNKSIQNYEISTLDIANQQIYDIHKKLSSFRDLEDQIIDSFSHTKSNQARDRILSSGIRKLREEYSNCLNRVSRPDRFTRKAQSYYLYLHTTEFGKAAEFPKDFVQENIRDSFYYRLSIDEILDLKNDILNFELTDSLRTLLLDLGVKEISEEREVDILLTFWASWCGPCRLENRYYLKAIHEDYGDQIKVVSISMDESKDDWFEASNEDSIVWTSIRVEDGFQSDIANFLLLRELPSNFLIYKNNNVEKIENMNELMATFRSED